MIVMAKTGKMEKFKIIGLVMTLIVAVRAIAIGEPPATNPDYDRQPEDDVPAARRIWDAGESAEDGTGQATVVHASYGVIPGSDLRGGGWSAAAPSMFGDAHGEEGAGLWDVVASESEARGVYSGERMRWMPTKSRYRQRKQPVADESPAEIPLQEHQRRQRLQLQQQLLKRAPEGRRGGAMQLENLGGGILKDVDDDGDEAEEQEEEEEEEPDVRQPARARSRVASPPKPFSKLPAQRPPVGTNEPTPGKTPSAADLKNILKMSGPLSLSEILQGKNLSLEELLKGSRVALSAVAQSATTETAEIGTRTEQRRRRLKPTGTRPLLRRRRPTTPPEFDPELPSTEPTKGYTTTTQATTQRTTTTTQTTTTSTTSTTTKEPVITTVEESEATTVPMKVEEPSQSSPWFSLGGDPARDILEIILQEDENDGPSLAEVLSSRNMTVADLIEQRERASGRSTITSLFPPPSSIVKEWQRRKGREEERKEKEETRENKKVEDGRKGRKFAHFDLTETNWEEASMEKTEKTPVEKEEEEIDDQQVTQTRNTYQVISSNEAVVHLPKSIVPDNVKPSLSNGETVTHHHPIPEEPKTSLHIPHSETKLSQTYIPFPQEIPTYGNEDSRPIIRTRVAAPMTSIEEVSSNEHNAHRDSEIYNTPRTVHQEYGREAPLKTDGLPEGVKSAIIASTSLLGIALLIFLAIFAAFRYRQWRRRRGMGPYLCAAVLEAAAGSRKNKGPKIIKKGKTKEKGWGDTFDSAQERLWRTLRRGRCRFYDRENGQM